MGRGNPTQGPTLSGSVAGSWRTDRPPDPTERYRAAPARNAETM